MCIRDRYDSFPSDKALGGLFFDFEAVSGDTPSPRLSQAQLKKRLGVFYKDMPNKEYKFLMNDQSELTLDDLRELLLDNEVKNFDPVAEAFKVYDPEGTGFVDTTVLKAIFENLGFGEISEDDLAVLTETGDVDGDGRISLMDFRKMLDFNKEPEPVAAPAPAPAEEKEE